MDRRIKMSTRALVLNAAGIPKEMEMYMQAPYAAGVAAAKDLKIGDQLLPAHQYATRAGFPSPSQPGKTPAWVDHWSFINGFIDTIGEIAVSVDKEGKIISAVDGKGHVK